MKKLIPLSALLLITCIIGAAQTSNPPAVLWPSADKPSLKLSFGKFEKKGIVDNQGIFTSDVFVQNVSEQGMPRSVFTVFVWDTNGVRIGRGKLELPEIGPYRTQTSQVQFSAVGTPASVSLLAGKTIPLRVVSLPPGATLKVDGEVAGMSPKVVDFTIGKHTLEFSKEGYSTGTTELDVGADELPGGSISFELGGLSKDTVELRDGTIALGDIMSMSMTQVVLRVDGKDQKYERNQVKKIMLVERQIAPATNTTADKQK